MEIYLIRHGECFDSTPEYFSKEKQTMDPPLTPKGIEQANKLASRMKEIIFDKVYTSDLIRAIQTSNIFNSSVNSSIVITKKFREIDMGDLYTKSWDRFPETFAKWLLHEEDIAYPNGETGYDVWQRCKNELDKLISLNLNRVAIICHGGTIRSIICGVLNIPQQKRFYLGLPLMNCSITIIKYEDNKYSLHLFNDYNHIL
jgi:probable phosphoglycerate mutase